MFKNYNALARIPDLSGQPVSGFAPAAHLAHRDGDAQPFQEIAHERSRPEGEPPHDVVARDPHAAARRAREAGELPCGATGRPTEPLEQNAGVLEEPLPLGLEDPRPRRRPAAEAPRRGGEGGEAGRPTRLLAPPAPPGEPGARRGRPEPEGEDEPGEPQAAPPLGREARDRGIVEGAERPGRRGGRPCVGEPEGRGEDAGPSRPAQRGRSFPGAEQARQLRRRALGGDALEGRGGAPRRRKERRNGNEAMRREESRCAEGAQRIVDEVLVAHRAQTPPGEILHAAVRIEEHARADREGHRVDREVAPGEIGLDRAALELGDVDRPPSREAKDARARPVPREEHGASVAGPLEIGRDDFGVAGDGGVDLGDREAEQPVAQGAAHDPGLGAVPPRGPRESGDAGAAAERAERREGALSLSGGHIRATISRMTSERPVVTPGVVEKVAELARLRVPDEDLTRLAGQLSRIVGYIDQLAEIPEEAFASAPESPATPVRTDAPRPGDGERALAANAPRQLHGYGVVPRVVGAGS
jgi:aspartyl-tRNA(Asn)/glutamyl-tRNA(Gln) amidotransferase subunit C